MRIEREMLTATLATAIEEGYVVIEARPKAGLTVFLSQIGSRLTEKCAGHLVYINGGASGEHIVSRIGEKLGFAWGSDVPAADFLRDLKKAAPLVLLIDSAECLQVAERVHLHALCRAFRNERIFVSAFAQVYVIVGTREAWEGSSLSLSYFTLNEVSALLQRSGSDQVALALYAWTKGSPELTRDMALALQCRETNVGSVYSAVRASALGGRLRRVAVGKPSLHELRRLGLANERIIPAMKLALKMAHSQDSGLVINRSLKEVRFQGRLLALFPQETRILCLLAENPGRVYTPAQIYSHITGGEGLYGGERSVKAQLSRLRHKLPQQTPWIITKRGLGYAFNPQATFTLN